VLASLRTKARAGCAIAETCSGDEQSVREGTATDQDIVPGRLERSALGHLRPNWTVRAMSGLRSIATELRTSLELFGLFPPW
jgi:hypothetical protein